LEVRGIDRRRELTSRRSASGDRSENLSDSAVSLRSFVVVVPQTTVAAQRETAAPIVSTMIGEMISIADTSLSIHPD
jgi:hypothetical protein